MTNFISQTLAAKKIVKRDLFSYLWTAKVQNIYLRINFMHYEITRKYPLRRYILGVLTHTTAWDQLWGGDRTLTMWF